MYVHPKDPQEFYRYLIDKNKTLKTASTAVFSKWITKQSIRYWGVLLNNRMDKILIKFG